MKRLCLIIFVITFFTCAGCSSQTAENAKISQEHVESVHSSIDNANSSSNNNIDSPNKQKVLKQPPLQPRKKVLLKVLLPLRKVQLPTHRSMNPKLPCG